MTWAITSMFKSAILTTFVSHHSFIHSFIRTSNEDENDQEAFSFFIWQFNLTLRAISIVLMKLEVYYYAAAAAAVNTPM